MCAFLPLGFLLMSMDIVHDLAWCLFPSPKTREALIEYYTLILTPRVQPLPWPGFIFPVFAVYVFVGLCPNWNNLYTFFLYLPLSYRYWRILSDRNGKDLLQSWWTVILVRILLAIVTWRNFTSRGCLWTQYPEYLRQTDLLSDNGFIPRWNLGVE